MNAKKACEIFKEIQGSNYDEEEKMEVILQVIDMGNLDSITKEDLLLCVQWVIDEFYEG